MTATLVLWAEPPQAEKLRALLSGAAAEAIHDAGACDHFAQIVEMTEAEPGLLGLALPGLSHTEAEVWRRVRETAT